MKKSVNILCFLLVSLFIEVGFAQKKHFEYLDVFDLQYVSDPQISPGGNWIVYRRMGFNIMTDRAEGNLWMIRKDGSEHQKLTSREVSEYSPVWSPNGDRIAFVSATEEGSEIYMYWLESGKFARISQLASSPSSLKWSPDGGLLAFSMNIPEKPPVLAKMPPKPKGAKWADSPRITDRVYHEADGRGYIEPGFNHLFVLPANGGSPRQLTEGNYQHRGALTWSTDGKELLFSANRSEDWEYDFRNSEIYSVNVENGTIRELTTRKGPDRNPALSPDGRTIAFSGYEDKVQAYQLSRLQLMDFNGENKRSISQNFDRDVDDYIWDSKGDGLYIMYDEKGNTKIAHMSKNGNVKNLFGNVGGTSIGRPYGGGSFSVSDNGTIAFTQTRPEHPAELAIYDPKRGTTTKITDLNGPLLNFRELGRVEEVWYKSSFDQRDLQGWVVYPPGYDAGKKYPFLVENHGGPISNYGDRFTAEIQLYASDGYIVFYPNARGSTSYGEEFGNLLYNNYPGQDYDDTMDGVNFCIEKGIAHEDQLFVTGGSAGGIMTAWIIGKNNRFEAAVVAKPVMNWISKTLVADNYFGYANSRYPGQPWENFEGYWKFSPLSLVGNVETPTMVLVGMDDLRTPPSEAKQLYHALKLRKIETVLVEIPGASHGIANKPSNLITKVAHTLAWLNKYRSPKKAD